MKRSVYLAMALLFVIVALHVPAVQAQSETKLKKIPLKYSDHIPPMAGGNIFLKNEYFPKLQKQLAKVGYELDITFYHAESLYRFTGGQTVLCPTSSLRPFIGPRLKPSSWRSLMRT